MGRSYIGASLFHMCTEETWHVSFAAAVEQAMDRYSQGAFFSSHIKDLLSILGFYCQCAFCLVLFLFFETNQPKQSVGPTCLFSQALSHLFLCHPSILKKILPLLRGGRQQQQKSTTTEQKNPPAFECKLFSFDYLLMLLNALNSVSQGTVALFLLFSP